MAIQKKNLRNFLQIFYAPERIRLRLIRDDVIQGLKKAQGTGGGGQFFYGPFWADAKDHAAGLKDLTTETGLRIAHSKKRQKTYPLLRDGFLQWWNQKRRWRNEPFEIISYTAPVQAAIHEIDCTIKIENMFSVKIDDNNKRLIYPYFSEIPPISLESARIAISIVGNEMPKFKMEEIRILDIRRGISYGTIDTPLIGDEHELFSSHYKRALADWKKIKEELG